MPVLSSSQTKGMSSSLFHAIMMLLAMERSPLLFVLFMLPSSPSTLHNQPRPYDTHAIDHVLILTVQWTTTMRKMQSGRAGLCLRVCRK
jgi:hypothetical protein